MKTRMIKVLFFIALTILFIIAFSGNSKAAEPMFKDFDCFNITQETEFGSISTFNPVKGQSSSVYVKVDFDSDWLSENSLDNYAGIAMRLKHDGTLVKDTVCFEQSSDNWNMTLRNCYDIILECSDADLNTGNNEVYVIFRCPIKDGTELNANSQFWVDYISVSSKSGKVVTKDSLTAHKIRASLVEGRPLTSDSDKVKIEKDVSSIFVKSANKKDSEYIYTYEDLISHFQISNKEELTWYFMYASENGGKKIYKKVSENPDTPVATEYISYSTVDSRSF